MRVRLLPAKAPEEVEVRSGPDLTWPGSTMHPQELLVADGIQHVMMESRRDLGQNPRTIDQSMCTDVIIGVVIIITQTSSLL